MTDKNILPGKILTEKAPTVKRIEYSRLSSKLKNQTNIAEKQYQGLDKVCEFDGKWKKMIINQNLKCIILKNYSKITHHYSKTFSIKGFLS